MLKNTALPLVSVVTPFHNTAPYLAECIESVLHQTYQNFEYILVNNHSTDSSADIARKYAHSDNRIRVLDTTEFLSQVQNYNHALRQISSDSDYVKVVESDNWIFSDCLARMVDLAQENPKVGIVSSYSATETAVRFCGLHISKSVVPGHDVARIHLLGDAYWFGAPTTILMRSSIVRRQSSFYSETAKIAEDLMVCYEAFREWDFGFVHQVLTFVRTENESILSKRRGYPGLMLLDRLVLLKYHGTDFLNSFDYESACRKTKRLYYQQLARGALRFYNEDFWKFHLEVLGSIGAKLDYGSLALHILLELLAMALNPGKSIGALLKHGLSTMQKNSKPRGFIAKQLLIFTLMLTISVSILTIAELALRAAFPEKMAPSVDYETLQPHPIYGYSLRPNIRALHVRSEEDGGQRIAWSTNSDGYRGESLQKKPDVRVVVYGDSNIQAVFSRLEDTFAKQLEARLSNSLGVNVEVINGGVVGYGPDQYLLRFIEEQPRLKANLVIFNIFADNDFGDLLRHRHFEARDGALTRRNDFFVYRETTWRERLQRFSSTLLITKAAGKVLKTIVPTVERSPIPTTPAKTDSDVTETYVRELRKLATDAFNAYLKHTPSYVRVSTYDIDVAIDPDSETAKAKVALMRLILKEAKQRASDFDVRFMVMIQPSRVDISTVADLNYQFLSRYPKYRADALVQAVERICLDQGIDVINLFPSFRLHKPEELYFKDSDNHWNDHGQAVAADIVAQRALLLLSDLKQ